MCAQYLTYSMCSRPTCCHVAVRQGPFIHKADEAEASRPTKLIGAHQNQQYLHVSLRKHGKENKTPLNLVESQCMHYLLEGAHISGFFTNKIMARRESAHVHVVFRTLSVLLGLRAMFHEEAELVLEEL